eukprot:m.262439 g.262439  ORF g.262439 m.262439 type:complete len:322 (+) comp54621_c0_seq12:22-987(+)
MDLEALQRQAREYVSKGSISEPVAQPQPAAAETTTQSAAPSYYNYWNYYSYPPAYNGYGYPGVEAQAAYPGYPPQQQTIPSNSYPHPPSSAPTQPPPAPPSTAPPQPQQPQQPSLPPPVPPPAPPPAATAGVSAPTGPPVPPPFPFPGGLPPHLLPYGFQSQHSFPPQQSFPPQASAAPSATNGSSSAPKPADGVKFSISAASRPKLSTIFASDESTQPAYITTTPKPLAPPAPALSSFQQQQALRNAPNHFGAPVAPAGAIPRPNLPSSLPPPSKPPVSTYVQSIDSLLHVFNHPCLTSSLVRHSLPVGLPHSKILSRAA